MHTRALSYAWAEFTDRQVCVVRLKGSHRLKEGRLHQHHLVPYISSKGGCARIAGHGIVVDIYLCVAQITTALLPSAAKLLMPEILWYICAG